MKKSLIVFIISVLAVGSASFFGGMKYASAKRSGGGARNLANFSPEQMQNRAGLQGGAGEQVSFGRGGREPEAGLSLERYFQKTIKALP